MKKIKLLFVLLFTCVVTLGLAACGNNDKVIRVAASKLPHADILNNVVKDLLKEEGYTLKVTVLEWTMQNDGVANKDYDANYFQHVPYLETYDGKTKLFAACKVHYEPLGIYRGKATGSLTDGKSFEICNDVSNAIRAFQLLQAKGVLTEIPVNEEGTELTFTGSTWTSENGVKVTLIAEELLVSSLPDYDFACLPCNTAITGNVKNEQVAKEDDPAQVALKANIIAARLDDYNNNEKYRAKIDALVDAILSQKVADYVKTKYNGAITCDSSSQIDLRNKK